MTSLACVSFMGHCGTHVGLSDLNLKDSALPLMNPVLFSLVDHGPALAWRRSIFSILACCRASPICAWSTMLTKTIVEVALAGEVVAERRNRLLVHGMAW